MALKAAENFAMEKPYREEAPSKGPGANHSAFLSLEWRAGRCSKIKIQPITLDGQCPSHGTSGRPMLATGEVAEDIVRRFQELSSAYGTQITFARDAKNNSIGVVQVS